MASIALKRRLTDSEIKELSFSFGSFLKEKEFAELEDLFKSFEFVSEDIPGLIDQFSKSFNNLSSDEKETNSIPLQLKMVKCIEALIVMLNLKF